MLHTRRLSRSTKASKASKASKTSRVSRVTRSSRASSEGDALDAEFDLLGKSRRYATLGACDRVELPAEVLRTLHDIGRQSSEQCRELGGHVRLDTMEVEWEKGLPGTGKASFVPSETALAKRNVVRFHCHPVKSFQTPPSYQDLLQLCKDYVQHHDGIIEHIIVTPEGFFLMCIPSKVVLHLDRFIASLPSRARGSGVKRKTAFVESRLYRALERFCKQIKAYQQCDTFNHTCVKSFIKAMRDNFGLPLQYKKFRRGLRLSVCRLGGKNRADVRPTAGPVTGKRARSKSIAAK